MTVLEKKTKMWKDYNDNANNVSDANDEDDKNKFQSEKLAWAYMAQVS